MTFRFAIPALIVASMSLPATAQDLQTDKDKQSYAVGVQMGRALAGGKDSLDLDLVIQGVRDVFAEKDLALDEAEVTQNFRTWQMTAREAQAKEMAAEGEAFLAANAERDGVHVLESGLQYEVITEGTGETPQKTDIIRAHYRGTLIDGTEFDSSYGRGEPLEAAVTGLIPGWTEALLRMKEGAKWKLYIPYNLAYGARGAGPKIPPYSALVFEMELVEIVDKPTQ